MVVNILMGLKHLLHREMLSPLRKYGVKKLLVYQCVLFST